jgi:hypothetical protein
MTVHHGTTKHTKHTKIGLYKPCFVFFVTFVVLCWIAFAKAAAATAAFDRRAEVGGRQGDRTHDLRIANAALSQLS